MKQLIREAKSNFYQAKFEQCKSDSKQTWETIKEVLHRFDKYSLPEYILINGNKITDKTSVANYFNNYFSNIGNKLIFGNASLD